jgi:hypothetical protein
VRATDATQDLAGYCGLYCGACDILRLYQDGLALQHTPTWSELPERLRNHLPIAPTEIRCHGCRSDDVFGGCRYCPIRACARRRGLAGPCTECASYPCLRMRLYRLVAWLSSIEKKLPHQKSKPPNLARIACIGQAAWLDEQASTWRCPKCSTPYSWYSEQCRGCGEPLAHLKGF